MVEFKVNDHTYKEGDKFYTSVTTVLKQYKPEFDSQAIAAKYAIKHPEKTAEEWIEAWAVISKESTDWGTAVHAKEEDVTKGAEDCRVAAHQIDNDTIRSLDSLKDLEDGQYPELLIWNNEYNIAGQIDKAVLKKGVMDLTDYKTYKKVDLKSFYNPRAGGFKMMLQPLQMLQDCNYNHAAIQIGTYAFMLEELGYKIGKLTMMHLTRDGERIPYSISYSKYKMFISFMLTHYKINGNS